MEHTGAFPVGATVTRAELAADPHPALARLRAAEPVSWVPDLGCWLVTSHAAALRVLRDPRTFTVDDPRFSTARVVGPSMLSLDGPAHAAARRPFAGPFRPAEVADRFTTRITELAAELVGAIRPAGRAELRASVAGPLAVRVVAEALGLTVDPATVLRWYSTFVTAVSEVTAGGAVPAEATAAFAALAEDLRAGTARDGSVLADAAAGGLGEVAVVSNAAVLLFGGIETTEGMILNALWHLLRDPGLLAAVREDLDQDLDLLPRAVEESLRLEPAAAVVDRYATRDVELAGTPIGRGDPVTVSLAGANRDPTAFPDPDAFDLRRAGAPRHLAFAHGPHACLAMDLARLETQIAVRTVLVELPDLRLDEPVRPTGLVFRKPRRLPVRWRPAHPRSSPSIASGE
ncbi:MAG TPA: cytochrome P450 [Pseudonocardia sp.]|jgi:cytochrome P450|uniref:cytochrome P450 n=1 Tax=Pseudonocardia sp. TaxID=60912 RepID=UPI002B4B4412|nr:cytochrome P450 [Pseudonocardia sp.]HLU60103.1 cytochrome P450 [Pseudonocardia sp.]